MVFWVSAFDGKKSVQRIVFRGKITHIWCDTIGAWWWLHRRLAWHGGRLSVHLKKKDTRQTFPWLNIFKGNYFVIDGKNSEEAWRDKEEKKRGRGWNWAGKQWKASVDISRIISLTPSYPFASGCEETQVKCEAETGWIQLWKLMAIIIIVKLPSGAQFSICNLWFLAVLYTFFDIFIICDYWPHCC